MDGSTSLFLKCEWVQYFPIYSLHNNRINSKYVPITLYFPF
jgi:hypothetical protein